ncbi:hypothetical protein [Flavobacterium nackdongense]|uniref:Signal peptidase n=1 Tax=Flavobacterium nackdongense TaxID=2547394 RepID=A0A4P6YCM4_9FLAO|nr:hypothetical protein [Flavobacterium nackdongense]QBN20018.1 hypothetical protein E1750_14835 [Flavobacterium nackdongense]
MKNNILKFYIAAVFFCSTMVLFAQPGDNDAGGGLEGNDPPAPIDDYVWVLALVGLFFVFMKFRAIHNKNIQV